MVCKHHRRAGEKKPSHSHPDGQIWVVREGLIAAQLDGENWILPQGRIGWVPPGIAHATSTYSVASVWTGYLSAELCHLFPTKPTVFRTTALSDALLDRLTGWSANSRMSSATEERLLLVLSDELSKSRMEPLCLPMPRHSGLLKIALLIVQNPSDSRTITDWAVHAGISERALTRQFREETGLSFAKWRNVALVKRARELLSARLL
nr:helix-turn-helix transcriptional regulator [Duganella flavida]